jgi:carbon-monoxide dehydrogenase large subunit
MPLLALEPGPRQSGAYVSTVAPVVPTMAMASAMGGVYDIPLIAFETTGVFTNTTPVDLSRRRQAEA